MGAIENYLLLMLCMKPEGKCVDLNHILEKAKRDLEGADASSISNSLDSLSKSGLVQLKQEKYSATPRGREYFARQLPKIEDELKKLNFAYLTVYKAKGYYPAVADAIISFCRDRYVGFYCVFTGGHFFRRNFRGKLITLRTPKDLLFYVDMHYIDVIPCVHRIGASRPDWLVVDLDAGAKVSFEQTKECAAMVYEVSKKLNLNPALKFSGSRGFQVWSLIGDFKLPSGYAPMELPGGSKRKKDYFSLFSDFVRVIQKEVDEQLPDLTTSEVTAKGLREGRILLDPSPMKEMGLVRSPYTIHHRTCLVSLPISPKELPEFRPGDASTEKTIERYRENGNEFVLKESSPSMLLKYF